ncbi:MAG TPA: outer membrane beta-barrel protein [Gemmatimonadaceae bacterium]|nr:outer membrane beta-barrel protein [Gemmatimonadaceae bacterium]
MRSTLRFFATSLVIAPLIASLVAASSALAQAPLSGTVLHVTPYAGYMIFGDYLKGPAGTTLSNAPGMVYGTQVGLSLSPQLSLIGNVGYTSSDIRVGIPFLGGVSVGQSSMLMYDAGLEYDFSKAKPGSTPLTPFVQAGVGAMRYNINEDVIQTQATNFAGNVGLGADVAITKGVALRFLAKDYIGQFNFQDATGLGISGQTANNFALSAGLRFDF